MRVEGPGARTGTALSVAEYSGKVHKYQDSTICRTMINTKQSKQTADRWVRPCVRFVCNPAQVKWKKHEKGPRRRDLSLSLSLSGLPWPSGEQVGVYNMLLCMCATGLRLLACWCRAWCCCGAGAASRLFALRHLETSCRPRSPTTASVCVYMIDNVCSNVCMLDCLHVCVRMDLLLWLLCSCGLLCIGWFTLGLLSLDPAIAHSNVIGSVSWTEISFSSRGARVSPRRYPLIALS